ncbi:hypothetical protein BKA67DRAFT_537501 [Truncatella angustata]|uniref:Uncharacterized protein n=1 Tax=Truncatella angustata TaxID=152316 RepID=A0A9P8UGD0_9PEZI|nr:uncharacterized protein BKA67DRAFT_537501 [Truncatella angustata]KAH6651638.1 hypothetical protein BKA67DRAFT_537501 [Truncatella angustata]
MRSNGLWFYHFEHTHRRESGELLENHNAAFFSDPWVAPMTVSKEFASKAKHAKIKILQRRGPGIPRNDINFNSRFLFTNWDLIGIYPPWYKEQQHVHKNKGWILCYKREFDSIRIVVFLRQRQAELTECARPAQGDPKKGWCWVAKLNEPFSLELAQRLLMDADYQSRLELYELRDSDGLKIPYSHLFTFGSTEYCSKDLSKDAYALMNKGNRYTDVDRLL